VTNQEAKALASRLAHQEATERQQTEAVVLREEDDGWTLWDASGELSLVWVVLRSHGSLGSWAVLEEPVGRDGPVFLHTAPGVCFCTTLAALYASH
jgi:hypothetical protein